MMRMLDVFGCTVSGADLVAAGAERRMLARTGNRKTIAYLFCKDRLRRGTDKLIFVGGDVNERIVEDIIDLHFVENVDSVPVAGVFCGFEDDLEPFGVGAVFFIEDDVADGCEVGGL